MHLRSTTRLVSLLASIFMLFFVVRLLSFSAERNRQQPPYAKRSLNSITMQKISKTAVVDMERLLMADEIEGFSLCPRWFEIAATLKKCFVSKLSTKMDLWNSIANISTACGADFVKNLLHSKYLINSDDVKAIVPPTDIDFNGVSLTIGIGNDTSVERRLKKTYPNIRFFGADPIYAAGKVFQKIGEYKQLGVSEKGGTFNASVLEGNKYVWRAIETVTVESLLRAFGIAHVDLLFLDIEGAEYSVLPVLSRHTSENLISVSVCVGSR